MPREYIPSPTRTLGIDLASQPKETAVCLLDWSSKPAVVVDLKKRSLTDDVLVQLMLDSSVGKIGIDAPFGWPLAFIDTIATYRDEGAWLDLEANELRFRATETLVAQETGQNPLSVATSDLAWPAMRCARLLSSLPIEERPLDRSGAGRVAEVYPMAALRRWGVVEPGVPATAWAYKGAAPGRRERRAEHLARLQELLAGCVELSDEQARTCVADDDDFDAFVSALVARAVEVGLTDPIPRGMRWLALREGWIHLPVAGSAHQLGNA